MAEAPPSVLDVRSSRSCASCVPSLLDATDCCQPSSQPQVPPWLGESVAEGAEGFARGVSIGADAPSVLLREARAVWFLARVRWFTKPRGGGHHMGRKARLLAHWRSISPIFEFG